MVLNIQILRFVAAMGVALFHTLVPLVVPSPYLPQLPDALRSLFELGFAGVDLFFVISGAVIAETTRKLAPGAASARVFVAVRLGRIYAGWWPFFLLYLAAFHWWQWPVAEKSLGASLFLLPLTDILRYTLPIVWTLSMEIYFYLVVGALLLLPRVRLRTALAAWALLVASVLLVDVLQGKNSLANYGELTIVRMYLVSPFVLEFISGFLLCELVRSRPTMPRLPWALASLGLGTFGAWYHLRGGLPANGLAEMAHAPERVLLFGGAACGLVVYALLLAQPTTWLALGMARLGDASYTLYLSHVLVLVSFYQAIAWLEIPAQARVALFVIAVLLVPAAAWVFHRLVERPLQLRMRSGLKRIFA